MLDIKKMRLDDSFNCENVQGVVASYITDSLANKINARKIPIVTMDAPPSRCKSIVCKIECDNQSIAQSAAEHLYATGIRKFAVMPEQHFAPYSIDRTQVFIKSIKERGCEDVKVFDYRQELQSWLKSLETPVAIFAVNDSIARAVVDTAAKTNLKIPYDAIVLGVDDEMMLCEANNPSISSIRLDTYETGLRAAELLNMAMTERSCGFKKPCTIKYKAAGITTRRSTQYRPQTDWLATKCLELIDANLSTNLKIENLAKALHVSRKTLESRFKRAIGHTIGREITIKRIEKARGLMQEHRYSQSQIADFCGFYDASHMIVCFRRVLGNTPSEICNG